MPYRCATPELCVTLRELFDQGPPYRIRFGYGPDRNGLVALDAWPE
jgi:hypothetical protein